jgi:ATPase family associated with various cellular activities (AAA)
VEKTSVFSIYFSFFNQPLSKGEFILYNNSAISSQLETALVKLVNEDFVDKDVYLMEDEYQKVSLRMYNEDILKGILKKFKFKDMGNIFDYPEELPQPEEIDGIDITSNFDAYQRIAVSEKINAVVLYTASRYYIECTFLIDTDKLEKFSKKTKPILQQDTTANLFKDIDLDCDKREFVEVSEPTGDDRKPANILKKEVAKESLVFDEESTIFEVMQDIHTFFTEETQKAYEKMQIAYKRGIILYGDPGNGKSAMIRQIIRQTSGISKIVINPNIGNLTQVLALLMKSLNGKQAIIVIEDIDSLINSRNRSEFLNLLDGVDINSGLFFIGTTNYPEQIDPAFMNRSGRFDRTYKINNPSKATRKAFFESRQIGELLSEYKVHDDDSIPDSDEAVVDLFVKYTDDMPMASLKEIMISTQYLLASHPDMTIETAVRTTHENLTGTKQAHLEAHESFKNTQVAVNGGPIEDVSAVIGDAVPMRRPRRKRA